MVIKSKIYDFLKKNLGEYLYGFEKNQLDVGLLSGQIELVNVNFRPDKVNGLLETLGFPVQLKAGLIGKLKFKCHYTSFFSSPVEVELNELLLVFGPITHISREQKRALENDEESFMWQIEMEQQIMYYNKFKPKNLHISDIPAISEDDIPASTNPRNKNSRRQSERLESIGNEEPKETHHKHRSRRKNGEKDPEENSKRKPEPEEKGSRYKSKSKQEEIDVSEFKTKEFKYETSQHSRNNTRENQENPEEAEGQKKGFLEKYFTKVLKNLTLTVKSVHIRFEDETYPYLNPLALGLSLERLDIKNIAKEWCIQSNRISTRQQRKGSTIKEISFTNLAIYIYSMASVVIPTSLWEATISSEIGIFDAFPAYEVREMIIQQSEMLSTAHPSTFVEPTHGKLCVTLHDEAPTLKVVGMVERVECKFTAAMAECMRNFFDYCTNVQIWPLITRHRPGDRIPERPEKREHRKERRKRREIVRMWFQYAFTFVKFKRAAIRYIRERKKEREYVEKLETQEKIRSKVSANKAMEASKHPVNVSGDSGKQNSIFSAPKQRKMPGVSGLKLDEIVKEHNTKRNVPVTPQQKLGKRPYDGEKYFPKSIQNSEIELHLGNFSMKILDEDTGLSIDFSAHSTVFSLCALMDELSGSLCVADFVSTISDQNKTVELANSLKRPANGAHSAVENCIKVRFHYRPAELIIPNDIYTISNMYECKCELGLIDVNYTHNILNHLFLIKEALEMDREFRERLNLQFIKAFAKHCKKNRMPKVFGVELKKFALSKKLAMTFVEFQKNLEEKVVDMNYRLSPILFNITLELEGGKMHFHDFSQTPILIVSIPRVRLETGKTKEFTFLNALGINLQTSSSPTALYDFLSTVGNISCEKLKQISICTSFKKIS